jgi:hypothetical protein
MGNLKIGDKVTFSKLYGTGSDYGVGDAGVNRIRKNFRILTIKHIDYFEKSGRGAVWFKEVECYWPIPWFEKPNIQLEFNFNG